ncbi:hypothetical protein AMJ50_00835 [Parcubacteria bacterium DG_74_3]|nr:MAG: hypothetical protein AMJ50_00835 [Parcubacteria bacterium DG_74_3]
MCEVVVIILGLFFPILGQAANFLDVVINEISWMGTGISYNDEWMEIFNNTPSDINLSGWRLMAQDGTPEISFSGTIYAHGFFLLERTDDITLPNIVADQVYKGSLNNDGEDLRLFDDTNNLVDRIDCSEGWFAGDNIDKRTMERKNSFLTASSLNWQTSKNIGGTPGFQNEILVEKSPESKPTQKPEQTTKLKTYPEGVLFNELLPSPLGSDAEEEWIEIFNQNNFEVNLYSWQIVDVVGRTNTYIFSEETLIAPQSFLVLSRPTTKITLNNSGDGLRLFNPNKELLDEVNYERAFPEQSYNLIDAEWIWSSVLTPGSANTTDLPASGAEIELEEREFFPDNGSHETGVQKNLATISEQVPKPKNFFSIFLIAFSLAILSSVGIVILKKKVEKIDIKKNIE